MVALAKDFKELGATNAFIKTGENRARTMTLWQMKKPQPAIEAIESVANSYPGVRFLGSEKGYS